MIWQTTTRRAAICPPTCTNYPNSLSYPDLDVEDEDFERLGQDFAETGMETSGPIGAGTGRLMRSRDVVDFAVSWMNENRR